MRGDLFAVNRDGARGARPADAAARSTRCPDGAADLVFVCTPNQANVELLRACAKKGVRAAFVASGGYGEAGEDGRALERELVSVANALGILLAGPNGQGVISTPVSMCAQIVAPYPPPGRISVASQSGNLVSSFLNYAVASGVGISKAISCGNSAQTTLADYLDYFGADPETAVALAYLEGVADGAHFIDALRAFTARKPLVLVKGGVAAEGKRAAASHTGSLASDDRVFDGICRQWGALRAPTVEEAYEWAATFATQPLPRGRRVVVFTTAGGWGVLAADACAAAGLELIALPDAVRETRRRARARALEPEQPDRPRRRRDARHDPRGARHRVRPSRRRRGDPPRHRHPGRERERARSPASSTRTTASSGSSRTTSARTAAMREAAREASERHGKPVLTATELVNCDRHYGNSGPLGVREEGRLCYASAHRAVRALRALVDYAEYRAAPLDSRGDAQPEHPRARRGRRGRRAGARRDLAAARARSRVGSSPRPPRASTSCARSPRPARESRRDGAGRHVRVGPDPGDHLRLQHEGGGGTALRADRPAPVPGRRWTRRARTSLAAQAQLAKDRANLAYAKRVHESNAGLVEGGAVSQRETDNSLSNYEQARAQVRLDEATVAQRKAALDAAQVNLDYTEIVSPVDGIVVSRNVDVGQTVAASFQTPTLFLIARDLTQMQVNASVSEADVGGVKVGQHGGVHRGGVPGADVHRARHAAPAGADHGAERGHLRRRDRRGQRRPRAAARA